MEAASPSGLTRVPQQGQSFENFASAIFLPPALQSFTNLYESPPTSKSSIMIFVLLFCQYIPKQDEGKSRCAIFLDSTMKTGDMELLFSLGSHI